MQKIRSSAYLIVFLLAGCVVQAPPEQEKREHPRKVWTGPVKEIPGVEPIYEVPNAEANQDYWKNNIHYKVLLNTDDYSEVGLAEIYDNSAQNKLTKTKEKLDIEAFAAGHPTLPIPSYLRVTNLANHRQVVVRVNDRATYQVGKIITLTPGVANRLNLPNNGRVKIEIIQVNPNNQLSGPGTYGTIVAKQSYNLPEPPPLKLSPEILNNRTPYKSR